MLFLLSCLSVRPSPCSPCSPFFCEACCPWSPPCRHLEQSNLGGRCSGPPGAACMVFRSTQPTQTHTLNPHSRHSSRITPVTLLHSPSGQRVPAAPYHGWPRLLHSPRFSRSRMKSAISGRPAAAAAAPLGERQRAARGRIGPSCTTPRGCSGRGALQQARRWLATHHETHHTYSRADSKAC